MFTQIKRIMVFAVLVFACFLLVACGEEKEPITPTLNAPTEIEVLVEFSPLPNATSVNGDDIVLTVEVAEGCDPEVVWESSNTAIATVDENGFVSAVSAGEVTITATSTKNPAAQSSVTLRVHPENIGELLKEAKAYVEENLKYIDGNAAKTKLPTYKPELLKFTYKNADTMEVYANNYYRSSDEWFAAQVDAVDSLSCTITYVPQNISTTFIVKVYVVKDVKVNDFSTVMAASDAIRALFANENLDLYEVAEKSLAIEKNAGVSVSWVSSNEKLLKVIQTAGSKTADKTDDEYKIKYTRPVDNTPVELTATILSAGTYGETVKFEITVKGFTKVEKVGYFRDTICANMPAATEKIRKDIVLPTVDSKFDMKISWASSNPELLSAEGVYHDDVNGDPNVGVEVTLTATLLYLTMDEENDGSDGKFTDPNSFKETVEFKYMVYPCTSFARAANTAAAYTKEHIADGHGWFPWGKIDREGNQLTGLPATLGAAGITDTNLSGIALNWECSEAGLFDENWNLLKQYLRYHKVMLTASVTYEGETEVVEVPLNVGIAQKERTAHIGGSFSRLAGQKSESALTTMDSLQTLSAFDKLVGTRQAWYKDRVGKENYEIIMGANADLTKNVIVQPTTADDYTYTEGAVTITKQFGIGVNCGFAGVTLYWDNEEDGIRYQYYACEAMTWVIGPDDVDGNGEWIDADSDGKLLSMLDRYQQNWDAIVIVNMSGKNVKIPVIYDDAYDTLANPTRQTTYVPYDTKIFGERTKFEGEGLPEISLGLCTTKPLGVVQPDGRVGCIEAEKKWEDLFASYLADADGEGNYCQYITLPNGGIAWSANSGQDAKLESDTAGSTTYAEKNKVATMFSTVGNQLTIEFWKVHPCNTFTTNDEWQLTKAAAGDAKQLGDIRVRSDLTTNEEFWVRALAQAGLSGEE